VGKNWVERRDGTVKMEVGDVFVVETPGGGGYGSE
jgi:N-methylhydantoinase B/oxoprolinase/acetone carboxylase alpha subunit